MPRGVPESWLDWKSHPITKAVFETVRKAIYATQVQLGHDAGLNPVHDRYLAGTIYAYENILAMEFEEIDANYSDPDDIEDMGETL